MLQTLENQLNEKWVLSFSKSVSIFHNWSESGQYCIDTISGLVNQIIEFRNTTQALFNFINSIKVGKPTMPAGTQRPQQIVLDCSELLFHGDTVGAQDSTFLRFETIFVCA